VDPYNHVQQEASKPANVFSHDAAITDERFFVR